MSCPYGMSYYDHKDSIQLPYKHISVGVLLQIEQIPARVIQQVLSFPSPLLHYRFPSRLKITVVQEPPKIWFYSFAPISWTHSITKSLRREGLEMTISQHCLWIRYNSSLKPKLKIWLTVNVKGFTAMAFCWILKPMQLVEYKTMIYHANCPFSKGYSNKIHKAPPHKLYRNDIANMFAITWCVINSRIPVYFAVH